MNKSQTLLKMVTEEMKVELSFNYAPEKLLKYDGNSDDVWTDPEGMNFESPRSDQFYDTDTKTYITKSKDKISTYNIQAPDQAALDATVAKIVAGFKSASHAKLWVDGKVVLDNMASQPTDIEAE